MPISTKFREVIRQVAGDRKDREVAEATGYSQPYINQILNGLVPPPNTLDRVLEALSPTEEQARLVRIAAGHLHWDPRAEALDGLRELARRFDVTEIPVREWADRPVEEMSPGEVADMLRRVEASLERRRQQERRGGGPELEYEPDLEEVDVRFFRESQGLPPEDIEEANAVARAFLREKRRRRGLL